MTTTANGHLPTATASFAAALREAVERRQLSLDRICHHLALRGVRLSPATLSHWQRGRSQPERPRSLRAVRELEEILHLPPGALSSLLQPNRPRGRSAVGPPGPHSVHRLYGPGSAVEQLLGDEFEQLNDGVHSLTIHQSIHLDARRHIRRSAVTQVVRALRDGADRLLAVHQLDEGNTPVELTVRCGRLGSVRFDRERGCVVFEVLFGRRLARNETAIVEYDVLIGEGTEPAVFHERGTRVSLREFLLHIHFDEAAPPAACFKYYRDSFTARRREVRRIALDVSRTAHLLPAKCRAGVHGIFWEWPPGRPRSG
ncbi:XRE family transcriptional regulator [Streptomyces coryli]|uniref:XRE family transcriptional regulator n=1 Tax=Streptomyces coryli TaxID=1128680 RepID=UPI0019D11AD7|nr:XRE family transcriptional regulator [Streptomyces coryli]